MSRLAFTVAVMTCSGTCSSLCCSASCETRHRLAGLAKSLTCSLQCGLVNLAITFDDVDGYTRARAVSEGGDLLGAHVPTHRGGAIEESLCEHNGLIGGHVEAIGK